MREEWLGYFKVVEEMGEVLQVLGKIGAFPVTPHPSGEDLLGRLNDELTDLEAAIHYFREANAVPRESNERFWNKVNLFKKWVLSGIKIND